MTWVPLPLPLTQGQKWADVFDDEDVFDVQGDANSEESTEAPRARSADVFDDEDAFNDEGDANREESTEAPRARCARCGREENDQETSPGDEMCFMLPRFNAKGRRNGTLPVRAPKKLNEEKRKQVIYYHAHCMASWEGRSKGGSVKLCMYWKDGGTGCRRG